MIRIFLIVLSVVAFSLNGFAQLNLFVGAGASYYEGDLKNTALPGLSTTKFSYKLGLGYDWQNRWGVRVQYSNDKYSGDDALALTSGRRNRGISFVGQSQEMALLAKYRLNNLTSNTNFSFYVLGGISGFQYKSVVDYSQSRFVLVPEGSANKNQLAIPFGLGMHYWFSRNFGLAAETMYHHTFTDYLDGVSKNGNSKLNDAIVDAHVSLLFRFSSPRKASREASYSCPSFK